MSIRTISPLTASAALVAATFVWAALDLVATALMARDAYPSVADLERGLSLSAGVQLPKDIQADGGQIFHSYYLGARALGSGRYSITVELKQRKATP